MQKARFRSLIASVSFSVVVVLQAMRLANVIAEVQQWVILNPAMSTKILVRNSVSFNQAQGNLGTYLF
jgi:hypothetical protein